MAADVKSLGSVHAVSEEEELITEHLMLEPATA